MKCRIGGLVVLAAAFLVFAGSGATSIVAPPSQPAAKAAPKKLGILVFPGVQVIDFTGPYEVLSGASSSKEHARLFDVVTVGLTAEMFRAGSLTDGIRMLPDHSIDDCPKLDILVIPGGEIGSVEDDPRAMEWIDTSVRDAECVMSVCNGAFILAKGGHLKNQRATTFFYFIDGLKESEPTCTPVHDERFVDNGKIITTAGLSSGIDGSLHLIERYASHYDAQQRALGLEYNWQPESNWSRGGLADRHYIAMVGPGFDGLKGALKAWTTVENNGTIDEWKKRWTFESALDQAALKKGFEAKMSASWTKATDAADGSSWTFKDDKGRAWSATLKLTPDGEQRWVAALHIVRG